MCRGPLGAIDLHLADIEVSAVPLVSQFRCTRNRWISGIIAGAFYQHRTRVGPGRVHWPRRHTPQPKLSVADRCEYDFAPVRCPSHAKYGLMFIGKPARLTACCAHQPQIAPLSLVTAKREPLAV